MAEETAASARAKRFAEAARKRELELAQRAVEARLDEMAEVFSAEYDRRVAPDSIQPRVFFTLRSSVYVRDLLAIASRGELEGAEREDLEKLASVLRRSAADGERRSADVAQMVADLDALLRLPGDARATAA